MSRTLVSLAAALVLVTACGGSDEPEVLCDLGDRPPGELVGLRADGGSVEWIDRTAGRIVRLDPGAEPAEVARVEVGTACEHRGPRAHVALDGRRLAAWTEPDDLRLVVGELGDDEPRLVWAGTTTASQAVGGPLGVLDGRLLLGLGELTGWAEDHGSGAVVTLDPDGTAEQEPLVVSDGWNNPWAFVVDDDGTVLLADNAPAGGSERLALIDPISGDAGITELPAPQRAPSGIAVLADDRVGVCGFLDGELRAYELGDDGFERAGTPGDCLTSVTVTAAGRTVVATAESLVALP